MNRIKLGVIAGMLAICTVAMASPKNNTSNKDIVDTAVKQDRSRHWPRRCRQPIWWTH